jgi:gamma-glutamyltranspeptidase/glutathione hydrolase
MAARVAVVAVALSLALAACSGDSDTLGPPPATSEALPPSEQTAPSAAPDPEPTTEEPTRDPGPVPVGAQAVSAGHPDAVDAGMQALADGGSAVDAAVAAAFAVSVVEPFASGVGGGGAALVHGLGEQPLAYDYREVVAADGRIPASGTGVPGFVAGLEQLHRDHGVLPWADLVQPAVALAQDGVRTTELVAGQLVAGRARLDPSALEQLFPGGAALEEGDLLVQPELAETLRAIADGGAEVIHDDALGGALTSVEGIDAPTLAGYQVATPDPVVGALGPYVVVGAGLPLTGVTVVQMLQTSAALGATEDAPGSAEFVDAVTTSWVRAEEVLRTQVGDPAYVDVPVGQLTDPERNAAGVGGTAVPGGRGGVGPEGGDGNTTHITVVDDQGTVVSMTNTLTSFWGSGQEVGGFFLNDQLRRFDLGSGPANAPEPGKRSVSYSSPTIVADGDGRPLLGIGSPGGARIPTTLTHVLLRWGFHDQSLQEAVDGPRFHLEGGVLYTEQLPARTVARLRELGYAVQQGEPFPLYFGSVQALEVDYERAEIRGAQDPRRAGTFAVTTGSDGQ